MSPSTRGFALMLFLAGFLLVFHVRANQAYRASIALPSHRLVDLSVLIRRQQESDRALGDTLAVLEAKQRQIEAAQAQGRSLDSATRRDLAEYRNVLGLARYRVRASSSRWGQTRHASPCRKRRTSPGVVNELWAAGAEAAAVNGVRVLATDGVVPLPQGVRIVGQRVVDPYAIAAIGDPVVLEGALLVRGGAVRRSARRRHRRLGHPSAEDGAPQLPSAGCSFGLRDRRLPL